MSIAASFVASAFPLDLSGAGVTLTAASRDLADPSGLPQAHLLVTCARGRLLPSGIAYSLVTGASGVIADVAGRAQLGPSGVDAAYLAGALATGATWSYPRGAGQGLTLSHTFGASGRVLRYNAAGACTLLPAPSSLGAHLMLMATHAFQGRSAVTVNDVFAPDALATASAALNATLAQALATALAAPQGQDALVKALVATNGPVLAAPPQLPAGARVDDSIAFAPDMPNLAAHFTLSRLPLAVTAYGRQLALELTSVPLRLVLASGPLMSLPPPALAWASAGSNTATATAPGSAALPGTYRASCSTSFSNDPANKAFDKNDTTAWATFYVYSSGGGTTLGTSTAYTQLPSRQAASVGGEWLQLQFPAEVTVLGMTLYPYWLKDYMFRRFIVLGSLDGATWVEVHSELGADFAVTGRSWLHFAYPGRYAYLRLVANQAWVTDVRVFEVSYLAYQ
jgi:hypothetical protein